MKIMEFVPLEIKNRPTDGMAATHDFDTNHKVMIN